MQNNYQKILEYALRITTKKRYTEAEMRRKIQSAMRKARKNTEENVDDECERTLNEAEGEIAEEDVVAKVIGRLFELKYLDDESYARDFVAERLKIRPRGKFLLGRELRAKGISKEIIEKAVGNSGIDEFETAMQLINKRQKQWKDLPLFKQKNKAYQFLSSKGIEKDAIYRAVNCCYNRAEEES